jgi:uncharacterized protein YjbI with pentapeptide repeats
MADDEQVAKLRQGVAAWNAWRQDNPTIQPDLSRITLEGTDFSGVNLSRTNLGGANLNRIYLIRADLTGADLSEASLIDATLVDATLSHANLSHAKLPEATLLRASLGGANLSYALRWRAAQLSAAYWDEQTIWPDGYKPPTPQRRPEPAGG